MKPGDSYYWNNTIMVTVMQVFDDYAETYNMPLDGGKGWFKDQPFPFPDSFVRKEKND